MPGPRYVKIRSGAADPLQVTEDVVMVPGSTAALPGTLPVINNQSPDFANLAAVTTAYNTLLAALRTRGVIGGS